MFGTSSSFTVTWRCPYPPVQTNGKWDEERKELSWAARGRETITPAQMLFAIWAEPAEDYQRTRFGQVALRGEALEAHVNWYQGLSARDQAMWDAFIETLRPGEELIAELERFRLPDASAASPGEPTEGARRLIDALRPQ
jgi:hypothetical protein